MIYIHLRNLITWLFFFFLVYYLDNKIVHGLFVCDFREYLLNNTFIALFPSIKDFFYDYNNGLSLMMIPLQMLEVP